MPDKTELIPVDKDDMWIFLLSTIRYSFGRQTYMTSLAWELVLTYADYLSTRQLEQIVREIQEELDLASRMGKTLGARHDHDSWCKGRDAIAKIIQDRHPNV